jgi:hypothetical protein
VTGALEEVPAITSGKVPATVAAQQPEPRRPRLGIRSASKSPVLMRATVGTRVAIALAALFVGKYAIIGADAYWLVALGQHIALARAIPDGVPFAAASTSGWPNVLVLAELVFAGLAAMGPAGLVGAQVVAVTITLSLVAGDARRWGAGDVWTAVALALLAFGALRTLGVVRAEMLSLVPFAVTLFLVRSEYRRASIRAWLLVPMFVIWSNLHGAALMGALVVGAYLLLGRLRIRPVETVALGGACLAALWVTPAHIHTGSYYVGVLGNEAARRGTDLWARPSLTQPLDVVMLIADVVLIVMALRRRLPLWEYVALAGLIFATFMAARQGLWLAIVTAAPAAAHVGRAASAKHEDSSGLAGAVSSPRGWGWLVSMLVAALLGCVVTGIRGHGVDPIEPCLVNAVAARAGAHVVLAPEPLVESLAVAGVRVWVSDPIDAFQRQDQAAYLDFLQGRPGGNRALAAADLVVVERGTPPARLVGPSSGWRPVLTQGTWQVLARE